MFWANWDLASYRVLYEARHTHFSEISLQVCSAALDLITTDVKINIFKTNALIHAMI